MKDALTLAIEDLNKAEARCTTLTARVKELENEKQRQSEILKIYYDYLQCNGYGKQLNDIIKEVEAIPGNKQEVC